MCGRYFVNEEEIEEYLDEIKEPVTIGEVFPSQMALALIFSDVFQPKTMKWGYPKWDEGILINTRSETADTSRYFQKDFQQHRCVIPASGFYEWDKQKQKYEVTVTDHLIYFAAIYHPSYAFSILTKQSYGPLSSIHHRTPILLTKKEAEAYCLGNNEILQTEASIYLRQI